MAWLHWALSLADSSQGVQYESELESLILISALLMPAASFTAEGDSIETKMSDSVITTKVKAAFAKSKQRGP